MNDVEITISLSQEATNLLQEASIATGRSISDLIEHSPIRYILEYMVNTKDTPVDEKRVEESIAQEVPVDIGAVDEVVFAPLELPVRACNILRREFRSIDKALMYNKDPLSIYGLGVTTAKTIAYKFAEHGYDIRGTVWEPYYPIEQ